MGSVMGSGSVALEAMAARAGAALACAFSNSEEFDAAIIAERRAAGIYGPRKHRHAIMSAAGVAAGLVVLFGIILVF